MANVFVTKAISVTPTLLAPTTCAEALIVMTLLSVTHLMVNVNAVKVTLLLMACVWVLFARLNLLLLPRINTAMPWDTLCHHSTVINPILETKLIVSFRPRWLPNEFRLWIPSNCSSNRRLMLWDPHRTSVFAGNFAIMPQWPIRNLQYSQRSWYFYGPCCRWHNRSTLWKRYVESF